MTQATSDVTAAAAAGLNAGPPETKFPRWSLTEPRMAGLTKTMYVIVSQVAAPAMTSVRVVDPRSETWKYRSSGVCPAVLGLGGDQIAIGAPFLDTQSAPRRRCAQGTDYREATRSIGTPRIGRKGPSLAVPGLRSRVFPGQPANPGITRSTNSSTRAHPSVGHSTTM